MTFSVSTTLRTKSPLTSRRGVFSFEKAARLILGARYDVSLVFVGLARSRHLNATYRGKNKPTNVLAFPLEKTTGEIVICLPYAVREARRFNATPAEHLLFLFVHGCLHLKGYDHGDAMERAERATLKKLGYR